MPIRRAPRREPRCLALVPTKDGLAFAAIDPWEVRSVGELRRRSGSQVLALRRLIRREKPSLLVPGTRELAEALTRAARIIGVPVLRAPPAPVTRAWARALFPELRLFAPTRALERAALVAVAAVLQSPLTPRTYAACRRRTLPHPA